MKIFGGQNMAEIAVAWARKKEGDGPNEGFDTAEANAARIVACVNACEGINPEAVKELLEALKIAISEAQVCPCCGRENAQNGCTSNDCPAVQAIAKAESRA